MNSPKPSRFNVTGWLQSQADKVAGLPRYLQIYLGSLTLLLLFAVVNLFHPDPFVSGGLYVAVNGFVLGFVVWAWPIVEAKWSSRLGKVTKTVLHLFAALIATAVARYQVSSALGLPAHDFDLTVAFFALVLYLPAWALIVYLLLAPIYLVGVPALVLSSSFRARLEHSVFWIGLAHLAGAAGLSLYAWSFFNWAAEDKPSLHSTIVTVAALVDYQPAKDYPGIGPKERVRLHENGIVSSVEFTKEGVVLRVRQLASSQGGA